MNCIRLFLASSAIALATLPVFAQESPGPGGPGPMYGYGHMWGGGWHLGMVFAPFVMMLALIGTVVLIVWLVRCFSHGGYHGHGGCPFCGHHRHGRAALEILEERLAKGEIGKDEFEEKRKLLGG